MEETERESGEGRREGKGERKGGKKEGKKEAKERRWREEKRVGGRDRERGRITERGESTCPNAVPLVGLHQFLCSRRKGSMVSASISDA